MWRWRNEHVLAWAICAAVIACPRGAWDAARLRLASRADRAGARAGADDDARVAALEADLDALRAAFVRTEAARADLARELAQSTALDAASAGVRPEARLPVRVFGAEAAASGAGASAARVRLDAGSRVGARPHAPLLDGAALVGRLVAVSDRSSEAELVTATTFRALCRDLRSGAEGMLRGAGEGGLRFVPRDAPADVRPGDALVTSAFSSFLPGGLSAGTIVAVGHDGEAAVRPAVDLARLERALVVLGGDGPP